MRQVFLQKGRVFVHDVGVPLVDERSILVRVHYSFISSGTENATINSSGKSVINKFISNFSANTSKVLTTVREHGVLTTLALAREKLNYTMPLGYSCSGEVVNVGKYVSKFRVGDFVACAGAGIANHAEFVSVPQNLAVKIDNQLFLKQVSLTTIGAIALQGVRRASLQLGEKVCVIGLGLLGLVTVQLAKAAGCMVFGIDIQERRLDLAKKVGASAVFNTLSENVINEIEFATEHYGVDATIITAASYSRDILQQAMQITRRKGRVVLVGDVKIDIDRDPFYSKEIDFLISCSYGPGRYDDTYEKVGLDYPYAYVRWTENRNMELFANLIQMKKIDIDVLISHEFPLNQVDEAYSCLQRGQALGVVLSYPSTDGVKSSEINTLFNKSFVHFLPKNRVYKAQQKTLNISIVGAGGFAKVKLLPIISRIKAVRIHSIVDVDITTSINIARQYAASRVSNDYKTFLGDDDVHGVVIATPHYLHAEQAIDFMMAGKAVFVEKPAAVNFEQFIKLKQFLEKNKNIFYCVDFNRTFSSFMLKIKEYLKKRNNPLLISYRMNAGYLPRTHWVNSSLNNGRIIGEGCHIFDLFCFLTDARPKSVSVEVMNSHIDDLRPTENFTATVAMSDGSCCSFMYTSVGNNALGKERMEIFYDGKSIVMDDFLALTGYGFPLSFNRKETVQDRGHQRLVQAFFEAAQQENGQPPISYERILLATELSLVVNKLAIEGGGIHDFDSGVITGV